MWDRCVRPHMDRHHVWVGRASYEFHLRLARALDARLVTAGAAGRALSFRELSDLLLAYYGHVPAPTSARLQLAMRELAGILGPIASPEPTRVEA